VAGKATAEHEFDATCKAHDAVYAKTTNPRLRTRADDKFVSDNMGKGALRTSAALAVNANRYFRKHTQGLRGADSIVPPKPTCAVESFQDQLKSKKILSTKTMTKSNKQTKGGNRTRGVAAVAYSKAVGIKAPVVSTRANGRTVISHREYVCPVVGSLGLRLIGKNVNPGLAEVFPWLSTIAANYEKYRMIRLKFQYITSSGTSTAGRVGLAFGYNPSEKLPQNKQEFFSIVPNQEEAPWEDITLVVPCTNESKYVRFSGISTGTVNTYDMGKIISAVGNNASGTATLGDLFVEYEVELTRPHYGRIMSETLSIINPVSGFPLGNGFTINTGIELVSWISSGTLEWEAPGDFQVVYYGVGNTVAPTTPVWSLIPFGNSDIQLQDIHITLDNGATQFGLVYVALLKNVQVGDQMTFTIAAWGQVTGGLTVSRMSQH
jgi:hypothetical protein